MAQSELDPDLSSWLLRSATYASLSVAITLILIKIFAFFMTDSVSLLSSLIDSTLDAMASFVNFIAVRQALVPADKEHSFGHGKAEPLAGLAQAAFIIGSSLFLCFEAVHRTFHPVAVSSGGVGIAVMVVSLVLTLALVAYQRHVLRRTHSLAIAADSFHYVSDIALNLGVIAALVLAVNFGWLIADPVIALMIAFYIIYTAWQIASQSIDQLMDRELSDADRQRIREVVLKHPQVKNIHDLRTRTSGKDIFIQLHMEMDGDSSLYLAHKVADEVHDELMNAFPNADILIHEDPAEI